MDYHNLTIEIIEKKLNDILNDESITISKEFDYGKEIVKTDYTIHNFCGPKYLYSTCIELFKVKWSDDKDLTGIYVKHTEEKHLTNEYLRTNGLCPVTKFGKTFEINPKNISSIAKDIFNNL